MTEFELDQKTLDVVHELVLRGLADVEGREYGEAYDRFVDAAGYPLRIGDQPDRVKQVWRNVLIPGTDRNRVSDHLLETENFGVSDEGDHIKIYKKTKDDFDGEEYLVKIGELHRTVYTGANSEEA